MSTNSKKDGARAEVLKAEAVVRKQQELQRDLEMNSLSSEGADNAFTVIEDVDSSSGTSL